jgi:hypothetical protein
MSKPKIKRLAPSKKRRPSQKQMVGFNKTCDSKVWYENEGTALIGLWKAQGMGWLPSVGRVYACNFCNGYHLTSKPAR